MVSKVMAFGLYTAPHESTDRSIVKGVTSKSQPIIEELGGLYSEAVEGWVISKENLEKLDETLKGRLLFPTDSITHSQRSRRNSKFHRARSRSPSRVSPGRLRKSGGRCRKVSEKDDIETTGAEETIDAERLERQGQSFIGPGLLLLDSSSDESYGGGSSSDSDFPEANSPRDHEEELKSILKRRKLFMDRKRTGRSS